MSHGRTQIRNEMYNIIASGVAHNVYKSSTYQLSDTDLPAILITTPKESLAELIGNEYIIREMDVIMSIYAKAVDDVDDAVDDIVLEIETLLAADNTLNGLAHDSYFDSLEIEMNMDQEQPICVADLTWKVRFIIDKTDPSTLVS